MFRRPRPGEFKRKFTPAEDDRLRELVDRNGTKDWELIATNMPLRNARQCRERWNNYINPTLANTEWTTAELELLEKKYAEFGPRWKVIAEFIPGRSKNGIKNHWSRNERIKARIEAAQRADSGRRPDAGLMTTDWDLFWSASSPEPRADTIPWDDGAPGFFEFQ
jgi:hypothetical protein